MDSISSSSSTWLSYFTPDFVQTDAQSAKGEFFFFLFAGSGAGGIGIQQIPKIAADLKSIRDLLDEPPASQGGEVVPGTDNFLVQLFYPQPIYTQDLVQLLKQCPAAQKINEQGTSTSFWARKNGYIVSDDFQDALRTKKCHAFTARATFDAMVSGRSSCLEPDDMDSQISQWRTEYETTKSITSFGPALQSAVQSKLFAYGGLAFLLLLIVDFVVQTGFQAFG